MFAMDALVIHLGVQELRCSLLCELILMSSHFSGIGAFEKAVDFLRDVAKRYGLIVRVHVVSACARDSVIIMQL